ncbi:LysR family transcriptional regulator [Cupriavidus gilardii]|uniref:LysR family transcriptional regulator n=1 Tax=Cupriavidus gilardii TaxID=82541 RepID=UPI001573FF4C|nr:LysR family transcriptional regulator [Cupriavidus gilardii]NSX04871.1 LysR family transcriptional regulator [Cupriavidus gilardii]
MSKLGDKLGDKRLGYFYEAATCGSVRGAADRLNVEPSVVSRQIQQLEQELGVALFERKGRGIVPTDAAALVLEHCRNRLASEEALRERIDELAGLRRGTLRLLVGEGYVDLLMNGVLDVFCRQYPGVQVAVELASAADAVAGIATDEAHIGVVMNAPAQADIEVVGECSQPVCIVTWPGHPLTKLGGTPSLREAADYPVAIMAPGFGLHQLIRLGEFAEGIQLEPAFTSGSIALLKRFVMKRLGVTFLSSSAVAEELARGELVAIRSGNTALEAAKTRVIVRKGRVLTEAARRMLGLLEGAFRQQQIR